MPSVVGKAMHLDLSLSGSRVVMTDPLSLYQNAIIRRSSIGSNGSLSPGRESSMKEFHTCSTVNPKLFPNAAQHQLNTTLSPIGSGGSTRNHMPCSFGNKNISTLPRVHLRNIPNGIAPLEENYDVAKLPNHPKRSATQEAQTIRKALNLERFKSAPLNSTEDDYGGRRGEINSLLTDKFNSQPHTKIPRDFQKVQSLPHGTTKRWNNRENTPKSPPSQQSFRSLPTPPQPLDNISIFPSNGDIIYRDSSAIDSTVSSDKSREQSALSDCNRTMDDTRHAAKTGVTEGTTANKPGES